MRKQIVTLLVALITTLSAVAQKAELKTAEKAVKNGNYNDAIAAINSVENSLAVMDNKSKAKFYFLKGQALVGKNQYKTAAETFTILVDFEKQIGKARYTSKIGPILNEIINEVSNKAVKFYSEDKDYKKAAENFYLSYLLNPIDTPSLYNAAVSAGQAKELDNSLEYYKKLKDLDYKGITVMYLATNNETGTVDNLGSKVQRDLMVKAGQYSNPKDKISPSKRPDIIKSIALILSQQGKTDEAIIAIQEARKEEPKDLNLLLSEADLYIELKEMDKFGKLMEEAVKMNPDNPMLFYNLGVVNYNQKNNEVAKKYYLKAIELKPDYSDAYMNLAVLILSKEQSIIEEMNKNLSNFDKYDALEIEQKNVYKEALPYLEKADKYNRDLNSVTMLLNIYESLEIEEKAKLFRDLYKSMK